MLGRPSMSNPYLSTPAYAGTRHLPRGFLANYLSPMTIRPCTSDDMAAVAGLFQHTFRDPREAAPASLVRYLRGLFLEHPWYDPEIASQVYIAPDGSVG